MEPRRCPNCSALVSEDAEWCGQCFSSLRPAPAEVAAAPGTPVSAPEIRREPGAAAAATWPCPACGEANPLELDACRVCGTPFGQLLQQDQQLPSVSPRDALLWSLTFPGIGHAKLGRTGEGIARGTLFVLTFGLTLVVGLSGVSSAALTGVVLVLLTCAFAVYAGSAWEAYRIADGGEPFVSARVLLWITVGVVMLAVALLATSVMSVRAG